MIMQRFEFFCFGAFCTAMADNDERNLVQLHNDLLKLFVMRFSFFQKCADAFLCIAMVEAFDKVGFF